MRKFFVALVLAAGLIAVPVSAAQAAAPHVGVISPHTVIPPEGCATATRGGTGNGLYSRVKESPSCGEVNYKDYTPSDNQPATFKLIQYTSATGGTGSVIASGWLVPGAGGWQRLGYVTGGTNHWFTITVNDFPMTFTILLNY
jgi:hypothetical protein